VLEVRGNEMAYRPTVVREARDIDWGPALYAPTPLDRWQATEDILAQWNTPAAAAEEVPVDWTAVAAAEVAAWRASEADTWQDQGHADDPDTDATHEVAAWSLRQAADVAPVLTMRVVAADAVRATRGTSAVHDSVVLAIRSGAVQAASSGRVMASRLALVTGIGADLSERRARDAAAAALDEVLNRLAAHMLATLDTHAAAAEDVLGMHTLADPTVERARRAQAARGRTWRVEREDGSTWSATDAGLFRAIGRVSPVVRDSLGYDVRLGYEPITCGACEPRAWIATDAPDMPGATDALTPTRAHVIVTRGDADDTRAAWLTRADDSAWLAWMDVRHGAPLTLARRRALTRHGLASAAERLAPTPATPAAPITTAATLTATATGALTARQRLIARGAMRS
jgi:hypothetical protein